MRLAVPLFAVPEKTARPPDFPGCCRPGKPGGAAVAAPPGLCAILRRAKARRTAPTTVHNRRHFPNIPGGII